MNLTDDYIDQLLGKLPKEKAGPDFAQDMMQKLDEQSVKESVKQSMLPERYFLLFSLIGGLLVLLFMADLSLVSQFFSQSLQFIVSYFQSKQLMIPSVLDTIRNLPALSLVIFPAIGLLLLIQEFLQKKKFRQTAKLF
jgi:hypothetical protein